MYFHTKFFFNNISENDPLMKYIKNLLEVIIVLCRLLHQFQQKGKTKTVWGKYTVPLDFRKTKSLFLNA